VKQQQTQNLFTKILNAIGLGAKVATAAPKSELHDLVSLCNELRAEKLAKQTWAKFTWQRRMTQWLRKDDQRDYKESPAQSLRTYWFYLPKFSVTHISAHTLSQMEFVELTNGAAR